MNTVSPNELLIDYPSWSMEQSNVFSKDFGDERGMDMLHKPMNKFVVEALARHPHDSLTNISALDPLPLEESWDEDEGNGSMPDSAWEQPHHFSRDNQQRFERAPANSFPMEFNIQSHPAQTIDYPNAIVVPTENMYATGNCQTHFMKHKVASSMNPMMGSRLGGAGSCFQFSSQSEETLLLQASEILLGRNGAHQGSAYRGPIKGGFKSSYFGHTSVSDSLKIAQDLVNSMEDYVGPFPSTCNSDGREYVSVEAEDVLLGRGAKSNSHRGNKRFHKEKAIFSKDYLQASTVSEKTKIAQSLVDAVASYGGRFLSKGPGGWYVVHPRVARTKASQALRDERRRSQGSRKP